MNKKVYKYKAVIQSADTDAKTSKGGAYKVNIN